LREHETEIVSLSHLHLMASRNQQVGY